MLVLALPRFLLWNNDPISGALTQSTAAVSSAVLIRRSATQFLGTTFNFGSPPHNNIRLNPSFVGIAAAS